MEYDPDGGCYFKFTFPPDIIIKDDLLKAYTGEGYLNTPYGPDIIPVAKDYTSDTKWAIFRACTYNAPPQDVI